MRVGSKRTLIARLGAGLGFLCGVIGLLAGLTHHPASPAASPAGKAPYVVIMSPTERDGAYPHVPVYGEDDGAALIVNTARGDACPLVGHGPIDQDEDGNKRQQYAS